MGDYVVYADVLFGINFFLDFILLWGTAKFGHFPCRMRRLLPAAFLGALYGVCILVPQLAAFYGMAGKIGFSLLMVWVAFGNLPLLRYGKAVIFFYLVSFAMAGAVIGGYSILSSSGLTLPENFPIPWVALLFAVAAVCVLARWGVRYLKRNWQQDSCLTEAEVWFGGKSVSCLMLLDTGNELSDPASGKPVMVMEYQVLKKILPDDFCRKFEAYAGGDITRILSINNGAPWQRRLRLVPFHAIGSNGGMLLGLVPDMVVLGMQDKIYTKDVIICIYQYKLGNGRGYHGIVNPQVLTEAAEGGGTVKWSYGA